MNNVGGMPELHILTMHIDGPTDLDELVWTNVGTECEAEVNEVVPRDVTTSDRGTRRVYQRPGSSNCGLAKRFNPRRGFYFLLCALYVIVDDGSCEAAEKHGECGP
jgi:hypothetical protein